MAFAGSKILIVDDDVVIVTYLNAILSRSGFSVHYTSDSSQAVELAGAVRPDLIILDWNMPGLSGREAYADLRALPGLEDAPILFLTGEQDDSVDRIGLEIGAEDILRKPVKTEVLVARVSAQLRRAEEARKTRAALSDGLQCIENLRQSRQLVASLMETPARDTPPRAQFAQALETIAGLPSLPEDMGLAILLLDQKRGLRPVAARGMDLPEMEAATGEDVDAFEGAHCLPLDKKTGQCLTVLPLRDGAEDLGRFVMAWSPEGLDEETTIDLPREIAMALSIAVSRRLMESKLVLRELQVRESRIETIEKLATMAEHRDPETGLHVARMAHYAEVLARGMGKDETYCARLRHAATMHDIGKVGIPDHILLKPGKLTEDEYELMKEHAAMGAAILTGRDDLTRMAKDVAASHHEKWNGRGYPNGLAGAAIPLSGRICAVADVFDALTMERPYKKPWPVEDAVALITKEAGEHFDPGVVQVFLETLDELLVVKALYQAGTIDPWHALPVRSQHQTENVHMPWKDSYSVGIDIIDEHHKFLFDLVDDLQGEVDRGGDVEAIWNAFKALGTYWRIHFTKEEAMMAAHGAADLDDHKDQHRAFERRIQTYMEALMDSPLTVGEEVSEFLRDWLVSHILDTDMTMKGSMAASGQRADASPVN